MGRGVGVGGYKRVQKHTSTSKLVFLLQFSPHLERKKETKVC